MGFSTLGAAQAFRRLFRTDDSGTVQSTFDRAILCDADPAGRSLDEMLAANEVVAYQKNQTLTLGDIKVTDNLYVVIDSTENITFDEVLKEGQDATHVAIYGGRPEVPVLWFNALGESTTVDNDPYIISGTSDFHFRFEIESTPDENDLDFPVHSYGVSLFSAEISKIDPDGNEVWRYTAPVDDSIQFVELDPKGFLYIAQSGDHIVRKIDPFGEEVTSGNWPFEGHSNFLQAAAVDRKGNLYVGGNTDENENSLFKLDPDGNQVWLRGWEGGDNFSGDVISVGVRDGFLYAGTGQGGREAHKFDLDGNAIWTFDAGGDQVQNVVIDSDGNSYWSTAGNEVFKLDPDGNEVTTGSWRMTFADSVEGISLDQDDHIYIATDDTPEILKVDPEDGSTVWSTSLSDPTENINVDPDGFSYVGTWGGMYKIDPDGNEVTTGSWPATHDGEDWGRGGAACDPGRVESFGLNWNVEYI